MAHTEADQSRRPEPDRLLQELADYTLGYRVDSAEAWQTARYCLLDALGCGLLALSYPACSKLIGPVVPGATLSGGARVPGTGRARPARARHSHTSRRPASRAAQLSPSANSSSRRPRKTPFAPSR